MAYTALNTTAPNAANVRGTDITAIRNNGLALRDGILMGRIAGFTLSTASNVEEPTWRKWVNASNNAVRATYTYSSGYVTQIVWEYAPDNATWSTICTETCSYVSTHQTGGANSSLLSWLFEWIGKLKDLRTLYTAHAAATGASAHGLGTISTQAANSVAITGGTINAASVGLSTAAEGLFTRACEQFNTYTPSSGASQALDWAKGGSALTNSGSNTVSFSNVPSARVATHALYCSVFNSTTFPAAVTWGLGGKPSIAGKALISLVTLDGGTTVYAGVIWREN
jgi:hypothetical protein